MLLAKVGLGLAGTVLVTGALAFHQGAITVHVEEHRPGGDNVNLILPAAAVPFAVKFIPEDHFRHIPPEAREMLPALRIACKELERMPDTVFVEVEDGREHVKIETRNGRLVINVDSDRETVHITLPLSTVDATLRELAEKGPAIAQRGEAKHRFDW